MIEARFMLEKPDEVQATMKITMSIGEWTQLRDDLGRSYPASRLSAAISTVVTEARKVYYATDRDALK